LFIEGVFTDSRPFWMVIDRSAERRHYYAIAMFVSLYKQTHVTRLLSVN